MKFRPCIDIHNGKVKQIVGSSLADGVIDNFVSDKDAAYYAKLYEGLGLSGGHIALLDKAGTAEYEADKREAFKALQAFPGGLQIGGGINAENAHEFIHAGASHVIVTSYIFENGALRYERLAALKQAIGKEYLVLDLSCRIKDGSYYVVTDRWQRFTEEEVTKELFEGLSAYCDEFLVHGEKGRTGYETDRAPFAAPVCDHLCGRYQYP